jgi:FHS family L-fucose permease-like MFS transporter
MIGRFMGAFALSEIRGSLKNLLVAGVPAVAFGFIVLLPKIASAFAFGGPGWGALVDPATAAKIGAICSGGNVLHYGLLLAVLLLAFFLGESSPHRLLTLFSAVIIALLGVGVLSAGDTAKWAVLGVGMFCSIMWSNIFSLAIEGLGPLKSQGSSLLIMAVLGGAILPPVQGAVADQLGLQKSYLVPMLAFAYIAFYGLYGYRAGRGTGVRSTPERAS